MGAVSYAAGPMLSATPEIWRRYVDLVFDGLRPEGAHPLSRRAPTRAQMDKALDAKIAAASRAIGEPKGA